jgi:hypothetical protein
MKTRVYFNITLSVGLAFCFIPKGQSQITQPIATNPSEKSAPIKKIDKHKPVVETVELSEEKIGTQGNWVRKKEWLKDTIKINEEIQKLVEIIQKAKRPYSEKTQVIQEELNKFYKEEGFEQGKLKEIFEGINKYLEKKKQKELNRAKTAGEQGVTGELEIKINLIEKEIDKSKNELEQLRLDMQSVGDLDKSLHDRVKKVDDEIIVVRNLSEKADQLTDETWYVIDDKIARKNYYELKGNILETIKALKNYLQVDLLNDFEGVIANIKSQIAKVKDEIKSLEEKEFIIKNRAERVEKIKRTELETLKAEKAAAEEEAKQAEIKKVAQQPWYKRLYTYIATAITNTYLFITNIFSSKEQAAASKQVQKDVDQRQPQVPAATVPAPIIQPLSPTTEQPSSPKV